MHAPLPPRILRGRVVTPDEVIDDGVVVVRGDRIAAVGSADDLSGLAELPELTDPSGPAYRAPVAALVASVPPDDGLILPGLVDLHCHGGGGVSFPDAADSAEARVAVREHLAHGTTSLVASLVTAAPDTLLAQAAILAELADAGDVAGIHAEGPFVSPARCGAQNPAAIQDPSADLVRDLARAARGHLRTMTLAPERDGADGVIDALAEAGAVPSLGHTDADAAEMEHGVDRALAALEASGGPCRVPTATHLFNGMRPIHHRDPGPALAAIDRAAAGDVIVELIADGVHLDPATVRYVYDLVGREQVVFVTDAMAAAGMPDGAYVLGSLAVTVAEGVARLTDGGSIAGGTSHLLEQVRLAADVAGIDLVDAVASASLVPAGILGRADEIGSIEAGKRADLVVVSADWNVRTVLRAGSPIA